MNILFVLYGDFYCKSASQVFGFANQLVRRGHSCAVAVPKKKESVATLGEPLFKAVTFDEVNAGTALFEKAAAPDIIHCWTPREIVRKFAEPLREKWRCKLAIHLDENERHLIESLLKLSAGELNALDPAQFDKLVPDDLSHPLRHKTFVESADGISVVMDRLKEFLGYNKPVEILWPGVDFERFKPVANQSREKEFTGIAPDDNLLAWVDDVQWANREEVRTLYLALGALNARGLPTKLLRAGEDFCPFLSPNEEWVRRFEIKLGRVENSAIPQILSAADVLIQPGQDDAFNAFRLPPMLPEFLAMGKPIILGKTNLGRFVAEGGCAIVLQTGCVTELAACAEALFNGPELRAHLGASGQSFARKYFNWEDSGKWMERFHRRVCGEADDPAERNPIATLAAQPVADAELPEDQAAFEQLTQMNCARWPAIVESLRTAEVRLAKMSEDGAVARLDLETRLAELRKTRSWRFMRFLRRWTGMLKHREEGGYFGFLKWLFNRPGATKKTYDPLEVKLLDTTDFDRSPPEKKP